MPELPEVETVARALHAQLTSRRISAVEVFWDRTIDRPDAATFCSALTGARVDAVGRRGKFITMQLRYRPNIVDASADDRQVVDTGSPR